MTVHEAALPGVGSRFHRDPALPFIEARAVPDGRRLCYARHSHESFSIGLVSHGHSTYLNGRQRTVVGAGTVVLMNPGDTHACNPLRDTPWSYTMLYVDTPWLTALQHDAGCSRNEGFSAFASIASRLPELSAALHHVCTLLTTEPADVLQKHAAIVAFFNVLQDRLGSPRPSTRHDTGKIQLAADYISDNWQQPLTLEDLCHVAHLSPSQLIRAFNRHFHMSPHAYLVNRRVQQARSQLRTGVPIAQAALNAGFADQAHLQRWFKKTLATTPGHYQLRSNNR